MKTYLTLAQAGFMLITLVYVGWLLFEIRNALRSTSYPEQKKNKVLTYLICGIVCWLIIISILAASGLISDFSKLPPPFMIIVVVPLITIIWITSTKIGRDIAWNMDPRRILFLQSFRIFVEVCLWLLFLANVAPIQMTFEGRNFDILSGILGPLVALLIARRRSRTLVMIYNIVGFGLLINIVGIAFLSTPSPIRVFMNEPANTVVAQFPVVWLPGILVPLAYTLHILSLKQLSSPTTRNEHSVHSITTHV